MPTNPIASQSELKPPAPCSVQHPSSRLHRTFTTPGRSHTVLSVLWLMVGRSGVLVRVNGQRINRVKLLQQDVAALSAKIQ